mgnify:CR=1 FL=1
MNVKTKPLADLSHEAIEILIREMGVPDTLRFMNQFTTGRGNYTEDREALLKGVTLEQILADIKADASKK